MKRHTNGIQESIAHPLALAGMLAVCGGFAPGAATAQNRQPSAAPADTLRYTLENTVLIALERNPTVTVQRMSHEITDTYRREARSEYDPVFSTDFSRTESKTQRFLGATRQPYILETKRFQAGAGLSETLPTGTTISLDAAMSGNTTNIYADQYTGSIGVTVTQSLLRGFGLGANMARLRKANIDLDISRMELKAVAERIVSDVSRAYWDLYLAGEEIAIQQTSLDLAQRQLAESEERVAVGILPELELAAVHAEVATRNEALIQARSHSEQARLALLYLLNPRDKDSWAVPIATVDLPAVPADSLVAVDDHVDVALKYRPDLLQAQYQLEQGDIDVVQTRNGLLPQLDVFVSLGRTSYAETFDAGRPDIGSDFYDIMSGVTLAIPVLDRAERARHVRAKTVVGQREEALANMEQLVQKDIRTAWVMVSSARELIDATRINRELQEKKIQAEEEKFRVGKSTNFLVLQAQRDYTVSRLAETRSLVDYLNALSDLYVAEGTLLERSGIDPGIE